jgi:hypothetical protein
MHLRHQDARLISRTAPYGDAHAGRRPVSTAARADRIMVLRTRTCTSQFHQNKLVLKTELF